MLRIIANVIWFIFFGFFHGLAWWFLGFLFLIFIVTIPWAWSCFVAGTLTFFPFGKIVVDKNFYYRTGEIFDNNWRLAGNLIWCVFLGFWIAIYHFFWSILFFISIIGIPFALQHLKLAHLILLPMGKIIIDKEELISEDFLS